MAPIIKEPHCWRCRTIGGRLIKSGAFSRICTDCNTEYHRELKRKKGAEYVREIGKRSRDKHREKDMARRAFAYAVKKGEIVRPDACVVCKLKKRVQGHHPDYSKPLEVMWLCTRCHADEHIRLKANN